MPPPVPTVISTGFDDATGSAYRLDTDSLLVIDSGSAESISAIGAHSHAKTVVGTGYTGDPTDIALSADGLHAYVSQGSGASGDLLRVPLSNLNRSAATVVASGVYVAQIALDEAHGFGYVVNNTGVQRITLANGVTTTVASVFSPRGVLVTTDGRFIYASSDAGTITRFDLSTSTNTVVASGLTGPRMLTWADAGQSVILFPSSSGDIMKLDLTLTPPAVTVIATGGPSNPYSVAVLSPNQLLITSANEVSEVDLTASVYSAGGPILLGVGFVPADATPATIVDGFADTTADPTYFFQVKDCPFGGTLPLMINWEAARTKGANFYQVWVTPPGGTAAPVHPPFSDYLWSTSLDEFELITTVPASNFYPLRQTGQIWLNFWLGLLLDTTGGPNGLTTISVKLFSAESTGTEIGNDTESGRFVRLMIDNTLPTAIIQAILQQPGNVAVGPCAIVDTGTPTFTFLVTASAAGGHLQAWSLTAYWGNDKSEAITSDTYANHVSPSRIWDGITGVAVPPPGPAPWNATVSGDPTSTHCAHSFFLYAWDRVINGWGFVHGPAGYQQSITLLF